MPAEKDSAPDSFHVLINAQGGTVLQAGQPAIEAAIRDSGLGLKALEFLDTEALLTRLKELKQQRNANLIVGGGDGTLAAAIALFVDSDDALGILPMGTMNLLARDLNVPLELQAAARAYASGARRVRIDVSFVNDHPFLCCAALGVMPEAATFREEKRGQPDLVLIPQLAMFVFRQLDQKSRLRMIMDGRGKRIRTSALIVSNNRYADQDSITLDGFKKESLRGNQMGVYTLVPQSAWDKLRFMLRLRLGNWKKDAVLVERTAQDLRVYTGQKRATLCLDGETMEFATPLHFTIKPKALQVILPPAAAKAVTQAA